MPENLNRTHPDYDATKEVRVKAWDLFQGSDVVKSGKKSEKYLIQGTRESDEDYKRRLRRAALDPFVEKIITARQALIFHKPASRQLGALDRFRTDVDRQGTPANVFFKDVARDAQVRGIEWVAVDMPQLPVDGEGEPRPFANRAEEEKEGHRPFFEQIPGDNVIDWAMSPEDGQLLWAVVLQNSADQRGEMGWGEELDERQQWKVWTRNSWIIYEEAEDSSQGSPYVVVDEGSHSLNMVPLIPFFGVKRTEFSGWSVVRTILDHIIQIYNKDSDLDWFEHLTSHPVPYSVGPEKPAEWNLNKGVHLTANPGDTVQIGYLEPSANGFESIRLSMKDLRYRIFSIALAESRHETAQVQNADSLKEDRRVFNSSIRSVSEGLESSEAKCWRVMARWIDVDPQNIVIEYNKDFNDAVITDRMISAVGDLVDTNKLTLKTYMRILKDGEILPNDVDIESEVAELERKEREDRRDSFENIGRIGLLNGQGNPGNTNPANVG